MTEGEHLTFIGPGEELRCEQDWTGPYIEACLASDVGRKRKNNEDSCLMCVPKDEFSAEWRGHLFAVADGMGGASAGERASFLTLQCLAEKYFDDSVKGMAPAALKAAIDCANRAVFAEAEGNPVYAGMGTTISALVVMGNWAYIGQVGDSRLYLFRSGVGIRQITEDHSLVAEQMRSGLINEEEARNHSLKNLITRAVGIKESVDVDLFALELEPNDRLLLCSDGLSNMVPDEDIAKTLSGGDLRDAVRSLVDQALEAGGTDNITAVALQIGSLLPSTLYQQGAKMARLNTKGLLGRLRGWFS